MQIVNFDAILIIMFVRHFFFNRDGVAVYAGITHADLLEGALPHGGFMVGSVVPGAVCDPGIGAVSDDGKIAASAIMHLGLFVEDGEWSKDRFWVGGDVASVVVADFDRTAARDAVHPHNVGVRDVVVNDGGAEKDWIFFDIVVSNLGVGIESGAFKFPGVEVVRRVDVNGLTIGGRQKLTIVTETRQDDRRTIKIVDEFGDQKIEHFTESAQEREVVDDWAIRVGHAIPIKLSTGLPN